MLRTISLSLAASSQSSLLPFTAGMVEVITSTFSIFPANRGSRVQRKQSIRSHCYGVKARRTAKPLEELYNIKVERKVTPDRLSELGVSRWSMWKTRKCKLPWDLQVDQLVYIEEGKVKVVPEGSKSSISFAAGDLIRYPKWFEAHLIFNGPYQGRCRFRAYGDD